jgi:hypothetical protein
MRAPEVVLERPRAVWGERQGSASRERVRQKLCTSGHALYGRALGSGNGERVRRKWGWSGRALCGASVGERECRVHGQEAMREYLRAIWGEFAERERGARAPEAVRERPRADLGE